MMEEKSIFVNGVEVYYKIAGRGLPLLILHGWGSRSDRWIKVADLLAQQNFLVVVPDLPGFGKSSLPLRPWTTDDYCNFVEGFAEKIGLREFSLLGHSFGGAVAALYASKFSQRLKALVLFASALRRRMTFKTRALGILAKMFRVFSFLPFYTLLRKPFYKYLVRKSDYPSVSGVMKETYLNVLRRDLSRELPSIHAPALILWGDRDDVLPLRDAHFIQQKIQNSKLAVVKGSDHDMEQHMPEQLTNIVMQFLRPSWP